MARLRGALVESAELPVGRPRKLKRHPPKKSQQPSKEAEEEDVEEAPAALVVATHEEQQAPPAGAAAGTESSLPMPKFPSGGALVPCPELIAIGSVDALRPLIDAFSLPSACWSRAFLTG
jgi:hypothetical protein